MAKEEHKGYCDCCGFLTGVKSTYDSRNYVRKFKDGEGWVSTGEYTDYYVDLCFLCANTGKPADWKEKDKKQMLCFVANAVIHELKKLGLANPELMLQVSDMAKRF